MNFLRETLKEGFKEISELAREATDDEIKEAFGSEPIEKELDAPYADLADIQLEDSYQQVSPVYFEPSQVIEQHGGHLPSVYKDQCTTSYNNPQEEGYPGFQKAVGVFGKVLQATTGLGGESSEYSSYGDYPQLPVNANQQYLETPSNGVVETPSNGVVETPSFGVVEVSSTQPLIDSSTQPLIDSSTQPPIDPPTAFQPSSVLPTQPTIPTTLPLDKAPLEATPQPIAAVFQTPPKHPDFQSISKVRQVYAQCEETHEAASWSIPAYQAKTDAELVQLWRQRSAAEDLVGGVLSSAVKSRMDQEGKSRLVVQGYQGGLHAEAVFGGDPSKEHVLEEDTKRFLPSTQGNSAYSSGLETIQGFNPTVEGQWSNYPSQSMTSPPTSVSTSLASQKEAVNPSHQQIETINPPIQASTQASFHQSIQHPPSFHQSMGPPPVPTSQAFHVSSPASQPPQIDIHGLKPREPSPRSQVQQPHAYRTRGDSLQEELQRTSGLLQGHNSEMAKLKEELARTQSLLAASTSHVHDLQAELAGLQVKLQETSSNQGHQASKEISHRFQVLSHEHAHLQEQHGQLSSNHGHLNQAHSLLNQKYAQLGQTLDDLHQKHSALSKSHSTQSEELSLLTQDQCQVQRVHEHALEKQKLVLREEMRVKEAQLTRRVQELELCLKESRKTLPSTHINTSTLAVSLLEALLSQSSQEIQAQGVENSFLKWKHQCKLREKARIKQDLPEFGQLPASPHLDKAVLGFVKKIGVHLAHANSVVLGLEAKVEDLENLLANVLVGLDSDQEDESKVDKEMVREMVTQMLAHNCNLDEVRLVGSILGFEEEHLRRIGMY